MRRFEWLDDKVSRFWEVDVQDCTLKVRYGRMGAEGIEAAKLFPSPWEAQVEMEKRLVEKIVKGYREVVFNKKGTRTGKYLAIECTWDEPVIPSSPPGYKDGEIVLPLPKQPMRGSYRVRYRLEKILDCRTDRPAALLFYCALPREHMVFWSSSALYSPRRFVSPEAKAYWNAHQNFFIQTREKEVYDGKMNALKRKMDIQKTKNAFRASNRELWNWIRKETADIKAPPMRERKNKAKKILALYAAGENQLACGMLESARNQEWLFVELLAGCQVHENNLIPSKAIYAVMGGKRHNHFGACLLMLELMRMVPLETPCLSHLDAKKLKHLTLGFDADNIDWFVEIITKLPRLKTITLPMHRLDLSCLDFLSNAEAKALGRCKGGVNLNSLESLPDETAALLSKHRGCLDLSKLTSLSDSPGHVALARTLAKNKWFLGLKNLTTLSDQAAEALGKHKGSLYLNGLTTLSVAAAEALGKHKGSLDLNSLTTLSDEAAEALGKHKGDLRLYGLTTLSVVAAKALSRIDGTLNLRGLTALSDEAVRWLSLHQGRELVLGNIQALSEEGAKALAKYPGALTLGKKVVMSDVARKLLWKKVGKKICFYN